jgi:predicted alpha/beta superfamily hydrolase
MIHRHYIRSAFVPDRVIDIWVPPNYAEAYDTDFPVIYLQDGQNLFYDDAAFGGVSWRIDQAMMQLIGEGVQPAIIVGIWSHPTARWREYMPLHVFEWAEAAAKLPTFIEQHGGAPYSDRYMAFLAEEVRPWVNANYRTRTSHGNAFVAGSSMGALIAHATTCHYQHLFCGAACLSPHWSALDGSVVEPIIQVIPPPGYHWFYYDYGTCGLDAQYEPYQQQADTFMRRAGFMHGLQWMTQRFEGADHNEAAWQARVHIPLRFLLSKVKQRTGLV